LFLGGSYLIGKGLENFWTLGMIIFLEKFKMTKKQLQILTIGSSLLVGWYLSTSVAFAVPSCAPTTSGQYVSLFNSPSVPCSLLVGTSTPNSYGFFLINNTTSYSSGLLKISTSTVNSIVIPNSGLVGISTTTPSYTLTVGGDINFTGSLYQNGIAFTSGGSMSKQDFINLFNSVMSSTTPVYLALGTFNGFFLFFGVCLFLSFFVGFLWITKRR
jgi:hypothetical protein